MRHHLQETAFFDLCVGVLRAAQYLTANVLFAVQMRRITSARAAEAVTRQRDAEVREAERVQAEAAARLRALAADADAARERHAYAAAAAERQLARLDTDLAERLHQQRVAAAEAAIAAEEAQSHLAAVKIEVRELRHLGCCCARSHLISLQCFPMCVLRIVLSCCWAASFNVSARCVVVGTE